MPRRHCTVVPESRPRTVVTTLPRIECAGDNITTTAAATAAATTTVTASTTTANTETTTAVASSHF